MTVIEAWDDWHATGPIEAPDAINPLFEIGYSLSQDADLDIVCAWMTYAQEGGFGWLIKPPNPFVVGWEYGRASRSPKRGRGRSQPR